MRPDKHNLFAVARIRYVQSHLETGVKRGPDHVIATLLPSEERRAAEERFGELRAMPIYEYLLARTLYYDGIFKQTFEKGIRQVLVLAAGMDTRGYRFAAGCRSHGVRVLGADLPQAIDVKRQCVRALGSPDHVQYRPVDLEKVDYGVWFRASGFHDEKPVLVLAEGITPYLTRRAVRRFLRFASSLPVGSRVVYDFKKKGVNDSFAARGPFRLRRTFRLLGDLEHIVEFHENFGLRVEDVIDAEQVLDLLEFNADKQFLEDVIVSLAVSGIRQA